MSDLVAIVTVLFHITGLKIMKLCYRGLSYQLNTSSLSVSESRVLGKYRSQPWHKSKFETKLKPLSSVPCVLKFRGRAYVKTCIESINSQVQPKEEETVV